jgi:glycosyltransferase involved in cell wall biosynthesis
MFNDGKTSGAGAARNIGAKASKAPYLLFLDADDWLVPSALETLLEAAKRRAIVYSDYFGHAVMDEAEAVRLDGVQRLVEYRRSTSTAIVKHFAADFERALAVRQPEMDQSGNFYLWNLITSLVPTAWHKQIGGFDEAMESWEDWDYWLRFARAGADFVRVKQPLVHYRFTTGNRREVGIKLAPQLLQYLADKAKGPHLMCCGSAPQQPVYTPPPPLSIQQGVPRNVTAEDYQMIELVDRNIGQHLIRGPVTKLDYGYRAHGDTFLMHVKDIEVLPSKEGHPRQVIRLQPAFNLVPNNERSFNENLDRTDVLPDNEPIDNEDPPIFVDGVPSLESVAYLTPKQRGTLKNQGVLTVTDALKMGAENLSKLQGMTPKRVNLVLDESTRLLNKYG